MENQAVLLAKKEDGEVRQENGVIPGDTIFHLLSVLMIDPLIKTIKRRVGTDA